MLVDTGFFHVSFNALQYIAEMMQDFFNCGLFKMHPSA